MFLSDLDTFMLVSINFLICFGKQMSYLVNSWHVIKSLTVLVFQSTEEQQVN